MRLWRRGLGGVNCRDASYLYCSGIVLGLCRLVGIEWSFRVGSGPVSGPLGWIVGFTAQRVQARLVNAVIVSPIIFIHLCARLFNFVILYSLILKDKCSATSRFAQFIQKPFGMA